MSSNPTVPVAQPTPLWQTGLLTIVVAVVANLILRFIVGLVVNTIPSDFQPLRYMTIVTFTVVGVLGAVIAYAIVQRLSSQPKRVFPIVALVALIISVIPDIAIFVNPAAAPLPNATSTAALILIGFHIVAAAVSVYMLTRQS